MNDFNLKKYLSENKLYKDIQEVSIYDDSAKENPKVVGNATMLYYIQQGIIKAKEAGATGETVQVGKKILERLLRLFGDQTPAISFPVTKKLAYFLSELGYSGYDKNPMKHSVKDTIKRNIAKKYPEYVTLLGKKGIGGKTFDVIRKEHIEGGLSKGSNKDGKNLQSATNKILNAEAPLKSVDDAVDWILKNGTLAVYTLYPLEKNAIDHNTSADEFKEYNSKELSSADINEVRRVMMLDEFDKIKNNKQIKTKQ